MPFLDSGLIFHETPKFNSVSEANAFREREFDRWVNGWQCLSGIHYFYVTQGTILSGKSGRIRPEIRDGDMFFLDAYNECVFTLSNMLELKWRGFGFSSLIGLIICYNAIIHPGCEQILTAPDRGRLGILKNKKIVPFLRGLQREGWLPGRIYDSNEEEMWLTDNKKKNSEASSIIYKETASDLVAVQNIEGRRALTIALDEWFNHNRAEDVLLSAEGSTTEQGEKFGTIIMGGSCNNINKEGVSRLEKMIHSADARGVKIHITPATISRRGFTYLENGVNISDTLKAADAIKKESEKLRESGDYEKYFQFKKENFLSLSDILTSSIQENISDDLHDKIIIGREKAYNLNIKPCKLRWTPQGIFTDYDEKGKFWIADLPREGHIYIAGCDPIPGTTDSKKGSEFVCVIKDITSKQYVAYYAERSNDTQDMYAKWKTLLAFYKSQAFPHGACCMVERNQMAFLDAISKERNEYYLLANDPRNPKIKGYHKPPNVQIDEKLNAMILNYLHRFDVPFTRFYDELDIMHSENADLMDAVKSCEYYYSFFTSMQDESGEPSEKKRFHIENVNGDTVAVWK